MNEARYAAFGAAISSKVYIAGGRRGQTIIRTCEIYNPLSDEWQILSASLRAPRMSASMVCHEGKLYVLGGVTFVRCSGLWSPVRELSVEVFDSEQNEWKEKSVIPVECFKTSEEEKETKFRACFARLPKGVIDKLELLDM